MGHEDGSLSTWPKGTHTEDTHEAERDAVGKESSTYLVINGLAGL